MTNLPYYKADTYFADKVLYRQSCGFSSRCMDRELDHKEE